MSDSAKNFQQCIESYEIAVYRGEQQLSINDLLDVLDGVSKACAKGGLAESKTPPSVRERWYTRLASAITSHMLRPEATFNIGALREVCRRKQTIVYVFNASGYRSTSHLLTLMSTKEAEGKQTVKPEKVAVLLGLLGIDDLTQPLIDLALKQTPEVLFILAMGWLNQRAVLTKQGERNRTALLACGPSFEQYDLVPKDIPQTMNAWMYSSYASSPTKHAIKDAFNGQFNRLLESSGVKVRCSRYLKKQRPRLVVIHERFHHQHAMYRCYAPVIRQLSNHFETVAVADAEMIDDVSGALFDEVIRFDKPRPPVSDIAMRIESLKPDMLYFPSIGMSHWVVLLATLRFAPVQIMTHGHPATSRLPTIDYAYTFHMEGNTAEVITERHVMGPAEVNFAVHSDAPETLPALVAPSDREVRVAVHAKVMKLSHRLIDICNEVTRRADVPVKYTFFPGERGIYFDGLEPAIKARVPNAKVAPYMTYKPFLTELSRCDLAFAAFPFGNTNSTVDTCLMGLPTVAHFGPENPAQSDAAVLRTAGFPNWLISHSDVEYLDVALKLVNDEQLRARITENLPREQIRKNLFDAAKDADVERVGEVFYKIYQNHEYLSGFKERTLGYKQILELPV